MRDVAASDAARPRTLPPRPASEGKHRATPGKVRQQLLNAIYAGQPFRAVLRDPGLTSNQVWGLTNTDQEWSEKLDTALNAARRDDLENGTNAVYVHGCVCSDCRATSASGWPGTAASRS
jgi:hypothetical protein